MSPHPDSSAFLIKQFHDEMEKQINNTLRDLDLTLAQLSALLTLSDTPNKTASLKELERMLCIAQSTTAGIIVRLEQKDFIRSFGDPSDKRIKMVALTPRGDDCCVNAKKTFDEIEKKLLSCLTPEEQKNFHELLKKVNRHIT